MPVRKTKGSWWIDFQFNRKRTRKRSPVNTKQGALSYEARLKNKILLGESIEEHEDNKKHGQLFKTFAEYWHNTYVKTNNKNSEIKGKRTVLERHLYPFFGDVPISKITTMQVNDFKAEKEKEGLNKKTINNYLSCLSCCLKYAEECLDLDRLPRIKRLKVEKSPIDFLTEKESQQLLGHCHGMWYDIVFTALKTGMRFGELRELRWEDINWENRQISVNRSIVRGVIGSPKSNQPRHIKMIPELHELLHRNKKKRGLVFSNGCRDTLEENTMRRELWRACKRARLRRIGWHKLRHSFASHLAMRGATIQVIQKLMGHADIATTMKYAHLCQSTIDDSISILSNEQCQPSVNQGENWSSFTHASIENNTGLLTKVKQKTGQLSPVSDCGDGGS